MTKAQARAGLSGALEIAELYKLWTGDDACGLKQAERAAWRIEDSIAMETGDAHGRLGSERDIAERLGAGIGVVREALEILDLRGVCSARRGPGGGIFIAQPSEQMTAQAVVNHLFRAGLTYGHFCEAKALLATPAVAAEACGNLAIRLLVECLRQIDQSLVDSSVAPPYRRDQLLSEIGRFNWQRLAPVRMSQAKRVAWAISRAIAEGKYAQSARLGSEWDLCNEYGVSRASMRQATRLLETFGIVESRVGRGNGLIPCRPNPQPVIRLIDSYFLALRLPAESWRRAIQIFGAAAIESALQDAAPDAAADPAPDLARMRIVDGDQGLSASRRYLRALIAASDNPILHLFWRSLAGYAFRAFDGARQGITSGAASLFACVPRVCQAVTAGDRAGAVSSYMDIFPKTCVEAWTAPA